MKKLISVLLLTCTLAYAQDYAATTTEYEAVLSLVQQQATLKQQQDAVQKRLDAVFHEAAAKYHIVNVGFDFTKRCFVEVAPVSSR